MQRQALHIFVALVTFLIGMTAAGLRPAHHSDLRSPSRAEQEVLSVEREYLDAHVEHDVATLDRILADDFTFLHGGRYVTTKAQRLALMENPDFSFLSIDTDDVDVSVNGDQAIVTGEAVVRGRYQEREFVSPPYSYLRVYEKRQGRWQIVSVEATGRAWHKER
jgi:ketosteroid isomerase-like protein